MWLNDQFQKLRAVPALKHKTDRELQEYLVKKYEERRIVKGRFHNNATSSNQVMSQETFINMYLKEPYILTGYSCFYKTQDDAVNISSAALDNLGMMRKINKKKMEASEHGSDDYIYYRVLQLTYKVLMNSYYGILGEKNSAFYNPYVQNSITMTGQDLITTSIIALEAFLSNNVKFNDTDDIINFISNVSDETYSLNILDYIDEPISKDDLIQYLVRQTIDPSVLKMPIIQDIVSGLSTEMVNRIYYKNQIPELLKNTWFMEKLKTLVKFPYGDKPHPDMVEDLEEFKAVVLQFAFYDRLYEDRYKRAVKNYRKSIITIDTDSNFINLNPHIQHVTEILGLDKNDEVQQMTVMNIFVNIVTEALKRTFWTQTTNMGVIERAKAIINMKSEFVYRRILLTRNKKSYAGIITAELGKLLNRPVLDMKGLSIRKTSVPKTLRKQFTTILQKDVLEAKDVSLKNILNKYSEVEEMVENSLLSGNVEYLLPKNLEVIESYAAPDTIEPVRATIIWNKLEPEDQIIPPEKINMIKLNCTEKDDPRLIELSRTHPDKYKAIMEVVFNEGTSSVKLDISRFGFSCIAIPKSVEKIPEYLLPFIDMKEMVNQAMTNGYIILESLGVYTNNVKTTKYKSNIIEL